MGRRIALLAGSLVLYVSLQDRALAQSPPAAGSDDLQVWNEVRFTYTLHPRMDWLGYAQIRSSTEMGGPLNERGGTGLAFAVSEHLTVTPTYFYILHQAGPAPSFRENRLVLEATIRFTLKHFNIADRSRVEWQWIQGSTTLRYKNRVQIERPFTIGSHRASALISNEILYHRTLRAWSRNRFSVGIDNRLGSRLSLEIYYLRQNDGRSGDAHVIGTSLHVRI